MELACPRHALRVIRRFLSVLPAVLGVCFPELCLVVKDMVPKEVICWSMMVLQNGLGCLPAWYLQLLSRQIAGRCVLLMHILSKTMYCQKDHDESEVKAFIAPVSNTFRIQSL